MPTPLPQRGSGFRPLSPRTRSGAQRPAPADVYRAPPAATAAADGGAAEQQWHECVGADHFEGVAQVELTGLEHVPAAADLDRPGGVGPMGVDHVVGVGQQGGAETDVVVVGVDLIRLEWVIVNRPSRAAVAISGPVRIIRLPLSTMSRAGRSRGCGGRSRRARVRPREGVRRGRCPRGSWWSAQ